jgi:DNA-binding MarR family transcriptional regulator
MADGAATLRSALGKRHAFDSLQQEAYLSLARTASMLTGPLDTLLAGHDLSAATYNVLRIVRGHGPRGIPSQSIGPMMVSRVPDVTRLVDRLASQKLVERVRCEEDRRVVYVRATRTGLSVLRKLDEQVLATHRDQFAPLTRAELRRLLELLAKLRQSE